MPLFAERRKNGPEKKTTTSENVVKVNDGDYLLRQIDVFKERAGQLQHDLSDREKKLENLKREVTRKEQEASEKEARIKELESVIEARRKEDEDLRLRTESQIREMTYRLEARIDSLAKEVENNLSIDSNLVGEQTDKLQWEFKQMTRQLDKMKINLSDKTHQENLSSYRNMVSSLEEACDKLETSLTESLSKTELKPESEKRIKQPAVWALGFSVLNTVILTGMLLYAFGIINF